MDIIEVLFGKLPGLLGDNHTRSYLLPTVAFVITTLLMLNAFGVQLGLLSSIMPEPMLSPQPTPVIQFDSTLPFTATMPLTPTLPITPSMPLTATLAFTLAIQSDVIPSQVEEPLDPMGILMALVIIALICWLIATLLLALNNDILKVMEGEGKRNLLGLLWEKKEQTRYESLVAKMELAADAYRESQSQGTHKQIKNYNELLHKLVDEFPFSSESPQSVELLMRTPLGNTIRAFEMYSFNMYGLDPSCGWQRLHGVLPDSYRVLVSKAKTDMDFWMNTCVLSVFAFIEFLFLALRMAIKQQSIGMGWWLLPVFILLLIVVSYKRVRKSAEVWGGWIKAAFDIYLPELEKKLGFSVESIETERNIWSDFSCAVIYRRPDLMPPRNFSPLSDKEES